MKWLTGILSATGILAIIVFISLIIKFGPLYSRLQDFDENAVQTYIELGKQILETGNAAEATVWKVKVDDGLSIEDVEQAMKFVANEHNIKNVGELPLYQQVEAMSGQPFRFLKLYMFCNALTAKKMVDFSDAYSAYLPCRVSLVQDKEGKLWIYSLNMDLMIYGGEPLPPALKEEAIKVKSIIQDIMKRGAAGEF